MTRTRKFVVPALVAALWVATFGFVPRVTSASPSSHDVRHVCAHLDTTAEHRAAHVCAAGPHANHVKSDGANVDEDGPDVACVEASGTFAVAALSPSIGEHRDSPYVQSHWESLAARAPPQS